MKIIEKINEQWKDDKIWYSFEYFPPKTDAGIQNLFKRIEVMNEIKPLFIDITWGAGGSTSDLSIEIATTAQNSIGVETQLHMTCTNMKVQDIREKIEIAKKNGVQNILCLRGDPPKGTEQWEQTEGGLKYAVDLVRFIRKEYGNYFGIAVAGYPEGHPDGDYQKDLVYLKEKIDAGADIIVTQLFYDCDAYLKFVKDCRDMGIKAPILPGIMPIHTYQGFRRMTQFCKTRVPDKIEKELSQLNVEDEESVKQYGIKLGIEMCKYLMDNGVKGIHFYTLNLEKTVLEIIKGLNLLPTNLTRQLPWKSTANAKRQKEDVRPIFWSNRPDSYLVRTSSWDEFPNGRWGDSRSPAFGEITDYHLAGLSTIKDANEKKKLWGTEHSNLGSISNVFISYLTGKINAIPWYEKPLALETKEIQEKLIKLNQNGFLTVNSQPSVNGAKSDDKVYGWGNEGGYVYQKAYVEFFASPETCLLLKKAFEKFPSLSYHAVNVKGEAMQNTKHRVNAVTWGVFPDSEIKQPTIVDSESFLVWKSEAFAIWKTWGSLYDDNTDAKSLINIIHDTFYLVNIVDNDYVGGDIFKIFEEVIKIKNEQK